MLTTQITELFDHIRAGQLETSATGYLEHTPADEIINQVKTIYRFRFQERRLREKWEIGLARIHAIELAMVPLKITPFPAFVPVPLYRTCALVSSEQNRITGLALSAYLRMAPVRKRRSREYALTTARGFNLFKAPDGWVMKPLRKRTVVLTEDLLRERGWQFEEMWSFPSDSLR